MPTYQYRCTKCDETFERYQSFTDDPIAKCPLPADRPKGWDGSDAARGQKKCRGVVRKVFGSVGVTFKGSGFYRNDSRAAANGRADSKTDASSPSVDGSSGDKSSTDRTASESTGDSKSNNTNEASSDSAGANKGAPKSDAAKPAKATSAAS